MTEEIIKRLCEAGHTVVIVGGAVRDLFLGHAPKDVDIATSATPEEILRLFPDKSCNLVGQTFAVTIVDGIDVATFRTEIYRVPGKPKVATTRKIAEDLSRRDLTLNSLALCPRTGDVLDLHGGRKDLKNKLIRFVGDPVRRINQDPVRIIRACRFKAKIQGKFHPTTFRALKDNVHQLKKVEAERIRLEILAALKLDKPSLFFEALRDIGALGFVFPSLLATVGFAGGEHHGEQVFEHCVDACDAVHPKNTLVRLAALLHDVGKPVVFDGEHFLNHELVGANIVRGELKNLKFANDEIEFVTGLIRVHMNLMNNLTPRATRRLLKRLTDNNVGLMDFMRLKISDRIANRAKKNEPFGKLVGLFRWFKKNRDVPVSTNQLAIDGHTIQSLLNIGPSKQVGVVKNALLEFVLEHGPEFNTREALINHVLTMWG